MCLILFDFSIFLSLLSIFSPIVLSFLLAISNHLPRCGGQIPCALQLMRTLAPLPSTTVSQMASPKTRRFSNVVFARLSIESWLPVSISCKRRQTPRAVSDQPVPAVNPHSRSQRSSPSSQSVWCETTLRDGSWRFPPLRCSDGSILDRTQRLFVLRSSPFLNSAISFILCSWAHLIMTSWSHLKSK